MKNFDIKRFSRTMIWNIKVSRREIITNTVSFIFVFLMFFGISFMEHRDSPAEIRLNSLYSATSLCLISMSVIFIMSGSWILNNMKTKQQRIMYMMLPASPLEKFLVRYVYVLLLYVVGVFVAFCFADLLRILICEIAGIEWFHSCIPNMFKMIFSSEIKINDTVQTGSAFAVLSHLLWVHSTYVLGGVLFCRKQFVFTSLFHLILFIAAVWGVSLIEDHVSFSYYRNEVEVLMGIYAALMFCLTVFDYWFSFRLFKRMQVINNKWINL